MKRWWRIQRAKARLRSAEASAKSLRYGHGYDVEADDHVYWTVMSNLYEARDALKELEG